MFFSLVKAYKTIGPSKVYLLQYPNQTSARHWGVMGFVWRFSTHLEKMILSADAHPTSQKCYRRIISAVKVSHTTLFLFR